MDPIKVLPCYSITIFTLKHSLHVHLNGSIIKTIMAAVAAVTAKGDVRTYYLSSTTDKVTDVPADYTVVNVLKWTGTPWINLCPFLLKTDGRESLYLKISGKELKYFRRCTHNNNMHLSFTKVSQSICGFPIK